MIESNSSAVDNIHLVMTDPYGGGWLLPTALDAERNPIMGAAAYRAWVEPRLAEKLVGSDRLVFPDDDFDIDPNRGY